MSKEAIDRVAQEWARCFPPAEPVAYEPVGEPTEVGKSSIIPNAGNQPEPFTDEQAAEIAKPPMSNDELLRELLRKQNEAAFWYGPQAPK